MSVPSEEWTDSAVDLATWAQQEGVAAFVVVGLDDGAARYIGPAFPPSLISKWLRVLADEYERQIPESRALN
jgi:hypothetical protein